MADVLRGFFTIWFVIGVGWVAAHLKVLDGTAQRTLAQVAFFIGIPALLFGSMRRADLQRIFSTNVIVSLLAVASTLTLYLLIANLVWRRTGSHQVIGGFASCYVNANNMGLPIAAYVLHDTSWVAPILLLQILALQPFGLSLLDAIKARREGRPSTWLRNLSLPFRNPMTVGTLAGLLVNLAGANPPELLTSTIDLVGGIAVPAMLISFGISLRTGPLPGQGNVGETVAISVLKVIVQPLVAFGLARSFGLAAETTLAVTVMAGLPTAQNVFIFAMRGQTAVQLARDVIFITSFASIPAVTLLAALVHVG